MLQEETSESQDDDAVTMYAEYSIVCEDAVAKRFSFLVMDTK